MAEPVPVSCPGLETTVVIALLVGSYEQQAKAHTEPYMNPPCATTILELF